MSLAVENILGIIDRDGEEELALDLSSFSCGVNDEIQTFLTDKAIEFARKKMSITYLVSDDEDGELLGYFTLAHKVLEVPAAGLSNNVKRRMSRYARLDESKDSYMVSAFLLAQFGKNYGVEEGKRVTGAELMDCVEALLEDIQFRIGGGVVYLDCEDKKKLIDFYENTAGYRRISERVSELDHIKYLQYFKFI